VGYFEKKNCEVNFWGMSVQKICGVGVGVPSQIACNGLGICKLLLKFPTHV